MEQNILFFTDLDGTIIYSTRRILDSRIDELQSVEMNLNKEPISYMTKHAYITFKELLKQNIVIPVTTRDLPTVRRLDFFKEELPEWLICDNGLSIYYKGERLKDWDMYASNKQNKPKTCILTVLERVLDTLKGTTLKNHNTFLNQYAEIQFISVSTDLLNSIDELKEELQTLGYHVLWNKNKMYILPLIAKKEIAIRYVTKNHLLNNPLTISAGDSPMDLGMLKSTDITLLPKELTFDTSELERDYFRSSKSGPESATDILNRIKKLSRKQY